MICRFCAAEMLRIILKSQEDCAKNIIAKNEMLTIELLKCLNTLILRGSK